MRGFALVSVLRLCQMRVCQASLTRVSILVDAALSEGLATEVIPGPSAVTCALVASGLASDHFFFEGFLPRKHGQIVQRLQQLASIPGTIVLYESPFRVLATVEAIAEVFPTRQVALVRELTKSARRSGA